MGKKGKKIYIREVINPHSQNVNGFKMPVGAYYGRNGDTFFVLLDGNNYGNKYNVYINKGKKGNDYQYVKQGNGNQNVKQGNKDNVQSVKQGNDNRYINNNSNVNPPVNKGNKSSPINKGNELPDGWHKGHIQIDSEIGKMIESFIAEHGKPKIESYNRPIGVNNMSRWIPVVINGKHYRECPDLELPLPDIKVDKNIRETGDCPVMRSVSEPNLTGGRHYNNKEEMPEIEESRIRESIVIGNEESYRANHTDIPRRTGYCKAMKMDI